MSKRRKIILAIAAALFIVLLFVFIFRGWVRGKLIPYFMIASYQGKVNSTFIQEYSQINDELVKYGLRFSNLRSEVTNCELEGYEGIKVGVGCSKGTVSDRVTASNEFIQAWKSRSPELEKYLLAQGWHKEWNQYQPINEIFNYPDNKVSIGVVYSKTKSKTYCRISIIYNAYNRGTKEDDFFANEMCERQIAIFGYQR